jgi:hypothetical protein
MCRGFSHFRMANKNPFADGSVKQGARLLFLKLPALKVRFKFPGSGPQVVCEVDEECRHMVDGRSDVILHRKDVVYQPE